MKNFKLWMGCFGNGTTVFNSAVMEHGDYKHIAHISDNGKIKLYVSKSYIPVKDMQRIVEERTNIPVGDLQKQEENQLRDLDKKLDEHVIGQTQAVDKVARAIRRNRIGLNKSGRPIGSFLFVGPTGVGKTETAKQLALQL